MLLSEDDLKDTPVLVIANKQDLDSAMSINEIIDLLGLHELNSTWNIQGVCAIKNEGLFEGLEWLTNNL